MYKAIDQQTEAEIIILSPEWENRIPELRAMSANDRLVCQSCRQSVRVRAGERRRHHFAHKHLADCTYGRETPEVLEARAVLYRWLLSKYAEGVTLEHKLKESNLSRAVDCWVELLGKTFAYWIIDTRMKREARENIKAKLAQPGIMVTWVFVAQLLQIDPDNENGLFLSPAERYFLVPSEYDKIGAENSPLRSYHGQTLHYLDAQSETMITYRSLVKVHEPNVYIGRRIENPMGSVRINPKTGEFVHPGEYEQLKHTEQVLERLEDEQRRVKQQLDSWFARPKQSAKETNSIHTSNSMERSGSQAVTSAETGYSSENQEYVCVTCGQKTSNWWNTFVIEGTRKCECRDCLNKRRENISGK